MLVFQPLNSLRAKSSLIPKAVGFQLCLLGVKITEHLFQGFQRILSLAVTHHLQNLNLCWIKYGSCCCFHSHNVYKKRVAKYSEYTWQLKIFDD